MFKRNGRTTGAVTRNGAGKPHLLAECRSAAIIPLCFAAVAFATGMAATGTQPRWLYALGVGCLAAVAFIWGMYTDLKRFSDKYTSGGTLRIMLEAPQEFDAIELRLEGIADLQGLVLSNSSGTPEPIEVALHTPLVSRRVLDEDNEK